MNPAPPATPPVAPAPSRFLTIPTVKPRLTYVFLWLNIIIFILQSITGADIWFYYGAKVNQAIVVGEWWRLITPMFLHSGLAHIAFNSYALYAFGRQVETVFGHRRFFIIYMVSGVAGSAFSFALSPNPAVGASGAIFGLLGALLIYLYRHRHVFGEWGRRQLMEILIIAGLNLLIGLAPGIDDWGHVGGLVGGSVLAWLVGPIYVASFEPPEPHVVDRNPLGLQQWLAVLAVALALGALTIVNINLQR